MREFFIKQGDTWPAIESTLTDEAGAAVVLSETDDEVKFLYRRYRTDAVIEREAEVVDGQAGKVRYQWVAEDTEEAGTMQAEWRVVFGFNSTAANPVTFPNDGYVLVRVMQSLRAVSGD